MSRLQEQYKSEIQKNLYSKLNCNNIHEVPKIIKIVLNIGLGEAKDDTKVIDKAPSGRVYLDGSINVETDAQSIKDRKNLSINGYLEITLLVSNNGKIKKPIISFKGIPEKENSDHFIFDMEDEIFNICRTFSLDNKNQQKNLIETIKQNCRRIVREKTGKKPFTNINIARI